ncbi:helix-turn-helix transcriptional regulator [Frankia sp. CNm7]|uniref:Helix-turn-helix transcriptional regulator n=1 Tax=Frankia nepalensis TaxID=1836974 RepID=A0A937USJ1_9ACTN|nr:XRE family transcriptional regulator [Frankia nepalensis]MBL7500589.1 helix-turn-helix transcriptional regulator [Frankia nepalensis]MBL7509357.1 helix-turn-helix transcriptional regulator [Frankia nepalensis]MBL7520822.1 helix-turn-helix transcriptional regulator [Frankia nepalensis]MBL7630315.1 helix-turn-helix transcriptional regulator [Frankia nepalensis]
MGVDVANAYDGPTRRGGPGAAELGGQTEEELRNWIGHSIRTLRRRQNLTLVQLAALAGLSHPFLSQLERGRARPSMKSLHRIAQALGTTQQALMSMAHHDDPEAPPDGRRVSLVRASNGFSIANQHGVVRALVSGTRAMYPLLFEGAPTEFSETYTHSGDEFVFVMAGTVEMEIENEGLVVLGAGDTLYYPGGLAHRWRGLPGPEVRALIVLESRGTAHR